MTWWMDDLGGNSHGEIPSPNLTMCEDPRDPWSEVDTRLETWPGPARSLRGLDELGLSNLEDENHSSSCAMLHRPNRGLGYISPLQIGRDSGHHHAPTPLLPILGRHVGVLDIMVAGARYPRTMLVYATFVLIWTLLDCL